MEGGVPSDVFKKHQPIHIFYRFQQNPEELWFPCENPHAGLCTPRIGTTDGWTPGLIEADWDPSTFNPHQVRQTGVLIRYTTDCWYSRSGQLLDAEHDPVMAVERVHPDQIRLQSEGALPRPNVSFMVVRWGGEKHCDPVHEGGGGWGRTGSNVSDPYMRILFEETVWPMLGPTYEVISVFVRSTEDLRRVSPTAIAPMLKGRHTAGLYFLWPCHFQDSYECPGYVNWQVQLQMMTEFEACGVPSRFPHHSHLYRLLLSKDWMAHLCMMPNLHAPATTKVSRVLVAYDKTHAADVAAKAIMNIQKLNHKTYPHKVVPANEDELVGVVKLGFSWEAMDVRRFKGKFQLAECLQSLTHQRYGLCDSVMVQEYVTFEVELRLFFIDPTPEWDDETGQPKPIDPRKILYTRFCRIDEEDKMRDFERMPRDECVRECFAGDSEALAEAEKMATVIGGRVIWWLQCECAEPPPVLRLDFMCHRKAPGKAEVSLGEITELGACFLGWPEGPENVFGAVVRSVFRLPCRDGQGSMIEEGAAKVSPVVCQEWLEGSDEDEEDEDDEDDGEEISYEDAKKMAAEVQKRKEKFKP